MDSPQFSVFAKQVRTLREKKGLTQRELADLLGLRDRQVQRWEASDLLPTRSNQQLLAKVLGVTPKQLFRPEQMDDVDYETLVLQLDHRIKALESKVNALGKQIKKT